jgi:hypothetical protein
LSTFGKVWVTDELEDVMLHATEDWPLTPLFLEFARNIFKEPVDGQTSIVSQGKGVLS